MKAKIKFNAAFLDFLINSLFLFFILSIFTITGFKKINESGGNSGPEALIKAPKLIIQNDKISVFIPKKGEIFASVCPNISKVLPILTRRGVVVIKLKGLIKANCLNQAIKMLSKHQIEIYWD